MLYIVIFALLNCLAIFFFFSSNILRRNCLSCLLGVNAPELNIVMLTNSPLFSDLFRLTLFHLACVSSSKQPTPAEHLWRPILACFWLGLNPFIDMLAVWLLLLTLLQLSEHWFRWTSHPRWLPLSDLVGFWQRWLVEDPIANAINIATSGPTMFHLFIHPLNGLGPLNHTFSWRWMALPAVLNTTFPPLLTLHKFRALSGVVDVNLWTLHQLVPPTSLSVSLFGSISFFPFLLLTVFSNSLHPATAPPAAF